MNNELPATRGANQPDEEFQKLVESWGEATSAGRHEEAEAIGLQLLAKAADAAATKIIASDGLLLDSGATVELGSIFPSNALFAHSLDVLIQPCRPLPGGNPLVF